MRFLVFAASMLAASAAFANPLFEQLVPFPYPPDRYAGGPFIAQPVIQEVPLRALARYCTDTGTAVNDHVDGPLACAVLGDGLCRIYMPSDIRQVADGLYEFILQHELGHCRGWRHR